MIPMRLDLNRPSGKHPAVLGELVSLLGSLFFHWRSGKLRVGVGGGPLGAVLRQSKGGAVC